MTAAPELRQPDHTLPAKIADICLSPGREKLRFEQIDSLLSTMSEWLIPNVSITRPIRFALRGHLRQYADEACQDHPDASGVDDRLESVLGWLEELRWTRSSGLERERLAAISMLANAVRDVRLDFARQTYLSGTRSTEFIRNVTGLLTTDNFAVRPFVVVQASRAFVTKAIAIDLDAPGSPKLHVQNDLCHNMRLGGRSVWAWNGVIESWPADLFLESDNALFLSAVDLPKGLIGFEKIHDRSYELAFAVAVHDLSRRRAAQPIASLDVAVGGELSERGSATTFDTRTLRLKAEAAAREGYRLLYAIPSLRDNEGAEATQAGDVRDISDNFGLKGITSWEEARHWYSATADARRARPNTSGPHPNPWPGLRPYSAVDTTQKALFLGRDNETRLVVDCLRRHGVSIVYGPSGVGKSSLVRAGIVEQLRIVANKRTLETVICVPGSDPYLALYNTLASLDVGTADMQAKWCIALGTVLEGEPQQALAGLLRGVMGAKHLLFILDQFEEAFQTGLAPGPLERFFLIIDELIKEIRADTERIGGLPRIMIAATIRGDFLASLLHSHEKQQLFANTTIALEPIEQEQLGDIITQTAERVGRSIEEGLSDRIVSDIAASAGPEVALPLINAVMAILWESEELTHASYQRIDSIGGVLKHIGDNALAHLRDTSDAERFEPIRTLTNLVFCQLVNFHGQLEEVGTHSEKFGGWGLSRQGVSLEALSSLPGATFHSVQRIVRTFEEHRLLIIREGIVELAHDILLYEWPWLVEAIRTYRATGVLRHEVERGCRSWIEAEKSSTRLWSDDEPRLSMAEKALQSGHILLTPSAREFLSTSRDSISVEARRKAIAERRSRLRMSVTYALATVAVVFAVIAWRQARRANREAQNSRYALMLAKARHARAQWATPVRRYDAIADALGAYLGEFSTSTDVRSILAELAFRAMYEPPHVQISEVHYPGVASLQAANDGRTLLTISGDVGPAYGRSDDTARLWNWHTGTLLRTIGGTESIDNRVGDAFFINDDKLLVTLSRRRNSDFATGLQPRLSVWDPTTGALLTRRWNGKTRFLGIADDASRFLASDYLQGLVEGPSGDFIWASAQTRADKTFSEYLWTDSPVYVENVEGDKLVVFRQGLHTALAPDGNSAAASDSEGVVWLWTYPHRTAIPVGRFDQIDWLGYARAGCSLLLLLRDGTLLALQPNGAVERTIHLGALQSDCHRRAWIAANGSDVIVETAGSGFRRIQSVNPMSGMIAELPFPWDMTVSDARNSYIVPSRYGMLGLQVSEGLVVLRVDPYRWRIHSHLEGTMSTVSCNLTRPADHMAAVCDGTSVRVWPILFDWPRFFVENVSVSRSTPRIVVSRAIVGDDGPQVVDLSGNTIAPLNAAQDQPWSEFEFTPVGDIVLGVGGVMNSPSDSHGRIHTWATSSGQTKATFKLEGDLRFSFRHSPAFLGNGGTRVILADSNRRLRSIDLLSSSFTSIPVAKTLAPRKFSSDGRYLMSYGETNASQTVNFIETATGHIVRQIDTGSEVLNASFSQDGDSAITVSPAGIVRYWDIPTGHERAPAFKNHYAVRYAELSVDNSLLVTVGDDDSDGNVTIWDVPSRTISMSFSTGQRIDRAHFSFDASTLVLVLRTEQDRQFNRWNTGEVVLFPLDVGQHVARLCELLRFKGDYTVGIDVCSSKSPRVLMNFLRDPKTTKTRTTLRVVPPRVVGRIEIAIDRKIVYTCFNTTTCSHLLPQHGIVRASAFDMNGTLLAASEGISLDQISL